MAPYGGALVPNVSPVVVAAVAVGAAAVAAPRVGVPNDPNVGVAPSCGVAPSVGVAAAAATGVPKPNVGAAAAACGTAAAAAVFKAPNVGAVVCGVPNENPDIFYTAILRTIYKYLEKFNSFQLFRH